MEQVVLVVLAWLAVGFLAAVGLGRIFRAGAGRERRKTQRRTQPEHRATLLEEPDRRRGFDRRREEIRSAT
jgi:hypothetical protein